MERTCVAYVVPSFRVGGLEKCVARLVNGLSRDRFRTLVVSLTDVGAAHKWIDDPQVPVIALDKRSGNDPRVVGRLAALLREHEVDIVHSHNWGTLVEAALARKMAGTARFVHAERGTVLDETGDGSWKRYLRAMAASVALSQADSVITVSHATQRELTSACHVAPERLRVIPNGVDPPGPAANGFDRATIRHKLGISPEAVVVGSAGRLCSVKGFRDLLRAFAVMPTSGGDTHLVLLGDGPLRDSLFSTARELGIADRTHFVGQHAAVGPWLRAMDIYVNSSHSEGMSQAVLEAMSLGLALVVTDVGDHALVVRPDGDETACGTVVPAGRIERMGEAMGTLVDDEDLRARLSRKAIARHRSHFDVAPMLRCYEDLYDRLMDRVSSPDEAVAPAEAPIRAPGRDAVAIETKS